MRVKTRISKMYVKDVKVSCKIKVDSSEYMKRIKILVIIGFKRVGLFP